MAPRKSEVRKIVRQYPRIAEAVDRYADTHDSFTWHTAMRLITCLHREPALNKALALMDASNSAKEITPIKACGSAVSRIMNLDVRGGSRIGEFQSALESLCDTHNINW